MHNFFIRRKYTRNMSCLGRTQSGQPCQQTIGLKNRLCPAHMDQYGDGMVSDARDFVKKRITAVKEGPSGKASGKLQQFLDKHKDRKVVSMHLIRKPVLRPVDLALNALSFGKYRKKQKELDYDNVYHNSLLVTLDDGKTYKLEKNERVQFFDAKRADWENEIFDVPLNGKSLTMKDMVETASRGNETNFYKYRAGSNNCQRFTRDIIEKNGLMPGPEDDAKHLEIQDAKSLLSTLPGAETIPNAVTDLANVIDRVHQGDGVKVIRNKKKIGCPL
jgi:hypothetical protein